MHLRFGLLTVIVSAACGSDKAPATSPDAPVVPAGVNDPAWAQIGKTCAATSPVTPLSLARRDSLGPTGPFKTSDDYWADAARVVPGGFGGLFLTQGVLNIALVEPAKLQAAVAGLRSGDFHLSPQLDWDHAVAFPARWDFAQLADWYRYLNQYHVYAVAGLTLTDIDEAKNRLFYGVADAPSRTGLEGILGGLDVPCFLVAIGTFQIGP